MTASSAFALKNSDLNAFLFADIGTELNGSTLTMLSMLARLGQDPWAEAARLAKLPKHEAVANLTQSLSKMPLGAEAMAGMHATAARLLVLLPGRPKTMAEITSRTAGSSTMPKWLPIALICASLVFGVILNMFPASVAGITKPFPMAQTLIPADPLDPMPQQRN